MMQHFPQRNHLPIVGEFRDVFADVVVKRKKSLFRRQHNAGSGELLGHRAHVKNGFRRNRDVEFEAAHAVAFAVNEVPVPYHTQRAARRIGLVVRGEDLIHLLLIGIP